MYCVHSTVQNEGQLVYCTFHVPAEGAVESGEVIRVDCGDATFLMWIL